MDSLYVKNLDKKDRDHMKKQQNNLKDALAALDIDETKFYEVLKDGPDPVRKFCKKLEFQKYNSIF